MQLRHTVALWLAALSAISTTGLSVAEDAKKAGDKHSHCKVACKTGSCDSKCEFEFAVAPACGTTNCLELLGKLTGLDIAVEVAEACCCSDACKCGEACKCSKEQKCQPTCKCDGPKAKVVKNIWGEKQLVAKKNACAKACACKKKGCCNKAVAHKKEITHAKKLAALPVPSGVRYGVPASQPKCFTAAVPHPPVFPAQIPVPYAVPYAGVAPFAQPPHAGPKTCPHEGTHAWHMHEQLVKTLAENAKLKAANEVQQQLLAQQKEHQKQMLEAQAQILRLQAQVELVSRQEEIRDQLVKTTVQAAQAEWLLEIANESPEAFVKMVRGEKANVCSGNNCEVQALKAENNALRSKVTQLEKQIQEIIKHTAQRGSVSPRGSR